MRKELLTFIAAFLLSFGAIKAQTTNHPGDVVIDGSQCVGFDCPTNPAFGFDTQRFVENNLRIHFDDSSNSASFPANDWRININDSSNGGANYFGIEDATLGRMIFQLMAGAPASSLIVDAQGDVGLGTTTPALELQITDGDTPSIRLEQNGSAGFAAQTWDIASNEANFFIRDATNGGTLPFRIRPGAPNNAIHVSASGNVALGGIQDSHKLYVNGDAAVNGDIFVLSDRRIKKDIEDSDYGLEEIMQLSAKKYIYDTGAFKGLNLPSTQQIGLIAQEVETIVPEVITQSHSTVDKEGETITLKGVNYTKLVPVLIQAVQEQNDEIAQLKTELELLRQQISLITHHLQEESMSADIHHDHGSTTGHTSTPLQDDPEAPIIETAEKPEVETPIFHLNNGRDE